MANGTKKKKKKKTFFDWSKGFFLIIHCRGHKRVIRRDGEGPKKGQPLEKHDEKCVLRISRYMWYCILYVVDMRGIQRMRKVRCYCDTHYHRSEVGKLLDQNVGVFFYRSGFLLKSLLAVAKEGNWLLLWKLQGRALRAACLFPPGVGKGKR